MSIVARPKLCERCNSRGLIHEINQEDARVCDDCMGTGIAYVVDIADLLAAIALSLRKEGVVEIRPDNAL